MSKLKHPMHILVIDKEFTDELPGMGLEHGVTRLSQNQYDYWLERAAAHLMTGLRDKMEYDPRFRQILPYTPVIFSDTPDNIDWVNSPLFLYQRTKQIGEERLAGNFSIGTGGHVDDDDVKTEKSIVNFKSTIDTNLAREVAAEELEFLEPTGTLSYCTVTPESHPDLFKFVPYGLIRDDSNNVGKVHLGVVNVIVVPTRFKVRCKEAELITHNPMTARELKDSILKFEGWTQILIDNMCGLECSVEPTPCRLTTFDVMSGQSFIKSRKGDKWTELAIEFNTTVATLYRLNMASFEGNDLDEGTRVNVPDQPNLMVKVETPENLIEALNNDAEGARAKAREIVRDGLGEEAFAKTQARMQDIVAKIPPSEEDQAKMTSIVLKGILAHGPDYENCGLIFLVTQEMADRLVLLDPAIAHLIEHGVVSIVDQNNLPGNAETLAVDPETAKHVKEGSVVWHFGLPPDAAAPGDVTLDAVVNKTDGYLEMPNPDKVDLNDPVFNAIWSVIKNWDVNVPTHYNGYCGANGSHVMLIVNELRKTTPLEKPSAEGGLNVTGDFVEELDFAQQVKLGEANGTPRHTLVNGDSINSICEKYAINKEDFERWNGFQNGHAWPTHTGYVFIADPALKWVPLLESGINDVTAGRGDTKPYEEPTL